MQRFDMETFLNEHPTLPKYEDVEAVPVRFLRSLTDLPALTGDVETFGRLPEEEDDVLLAIHALQPMGAKPLQLSDIHFRFMEAANDSFIPGRWMFLEESTLRNICTGAVSGFAFMNSHRTGGWLSEGELPFGRTFGGRFEVWTDPQTGQTCRRAVVGIYMRRGVEPNGANGPSTDAMAAMIDAGTVFDVSVGLYGGERICDVCGNGLYAYDRVTGDYLCPHAPGTSRGMSASQIETQKSRGVPNGYGSYSLRHARCGEVSAVYDGAVSRAGFLKTLALAKRNALSPEELGQARSAYATLLSKGDLEPMDEILQAIKNGFNGMREMLADKAQTPPAPPTPAPAPAPDSNAQLAAIQAQLTAVNAQLSAQQEQNQTLAKRLDDEAKQTRLSEANNWIVEQIRQNRLTANAGKKAFALAAQNIDAFEASKDIILANGKVVMLSGLDQSASGTIDGDEAQGALFSADPNQQLADAALTLSQEQKISYSEALRRVAQERPELAAANRAQMEG